VKSFLILYGIVLLVFPTIAQITPTSPATDFTRHLIGIKSKDVDSIKRKAGMKIMNVPDTLTLSDYMMSVERVNDDLNSIRDSAQLSFETVRMGRKFNDISTDIKQLRLNARDRRSAVNIKNTYLYQSFAGELKENNDRLRSRVSFLYNRTFHAKQNLKKAMADSVFQVLLKEKNIPDILSSKLVRLNRKWVRTDSIVKNSMDTLNVLQVATSDNAVNLSNMLNIMDKRLDRARPQIFGHEMNPLWKM
jgi:hypothetical protein